MDFVEHYYSIFFSLFETILEFLTLIEEGKLHCDENKYQTVAIHLHASKIQFFWSILDQVVKFQGSLLNLHFIHSTLLAQHINLAILVIRNIWNTSAQKLKVKMSHYRKKGKNKCQAERLFWLISRYSPRSMESKLFTYKVLLRLAGSLSILYYC